MTGLIIRILTCFLPAADARLQVRRQIRWRATELDLRSIIEAGSIPLNGRHLVRLRSDVDVTDDTNESINLK